MKKSLGIILSILVWLYWACEQDKGTVEITEKAEFKEIITDPCFYGLAGSGHDEIVITDQASYEAFADSIRMELTGQSCDTAALPAVDFDRHTLLGKHTSGSGCSAIYSRRIYDDKDQQKIIYKINVEYIGDCEMLIGNWNWACIPKLKEGYSIEFETR